MTAVAHGEPPRSEAASGEGKTELERLFEHMLRIDASDLYLTCDSPPVYRVMGEGLKGRTALKPGHLEAFIEELLGPEEKAELARKRELNVALERGEGRFRINFFYQRGNLGLVVRLVRSKISTVDDLGYPPVIKTIALSARGLVLVVGATGSGKSTLLAAMIDHRNASQSGHIVTIEDPIEFVHPHKQCVVTQREVGVDTLSYASALKNALRQAPDVIMLGEIRDAETMSAAVEFAETGHLCISTLHANNANQAVERVLNFFPPERHGEIRMQLSLNLRAIVSQRLVPARTSGRAAALEILLDVPRVRDLVKRGEIEALKTAMEQSQHEGCRTFDASLYELVARGVVDEATALAAADSANNLRLSLERLRRGEPDGSSAPPLRLLPVCD
jgi:twitching motility protein PilU